MILIDSGLNWIRGVDLMEGGRDSSDQDNRSNNFLEITLDHNERNMSENKKVAKGIMSDFSILRVLWSKLISKYSLRDRQIICTVPPITPCSLRVLYETLVFTCGSAKAVKLLPRASIVAHILSESVNLIVDIGATCTWISPYVNGKAVKQQIRRIDIGFSYLKFHSSKSHKSFNMAQQRDASEEAFEALFNPHLADVHQMGLAEAIIDSISVFKPAVQLAFIENVVLIGELLEDKRFDDHLRNELQSMLPTFFNVKISKVGIDDMFCMLDSKGFDFEASKLVSRDEYLKTPAIAHEKQWCF